MLVAIVLSSWPLVLTRRYDGSVWRIVAVCVVGAIACAPDAVLAPDSAGGSAGAAGHGGEEQAGGGGGGGGPLECNSSYGDVPKGECDLWLQDCPPPKRCTVMYLGGTEYVTTCADPKGGKLAGENCQLATECEWGLDCQLGRCVPVCCPDSNVPCGEDAYCMIRLSYGPYFVKRCAFLESCDLFAPGTCDRAEPPGNCHVVVPYDKTACVPPPAAGVKQAGEPCQTGADCDDFMVCIGAMATCRWLCYLDGSGNGMPGGGGCPSGDMCGIAPAVGIDNIGVCG